MSTSDTGSTKAANNTTGISLPAFLTALGTSAIVFAVQISLFLLLRNKLSRIYRPKTYLVPDRERTDPPPVSPWGIFRALFRYSDRELIKKCGLDAYFFLRYLKTLLVIFVPIAVIVIPILIPMNYVGGLGHNVSTNSTGVDSGIPTGLDTLGWGNIVPARYRRRWAHLVLAVCVIVWVCFVFFNEMRIYVKVRQDYLTSAEHRLRASANTVLVSSIPPKWLSEEALTGLFDVFPGGIRNIWLTRDFTALLDKINKRNSIHEQLESAETELIRECKKRQIKQREKEEKQRRKELKVKGPTKQEKEERSKQEDAEAKNRAEASNGVASGDHEEVPQNAHEEHKIDTDQTKPQTRHDDDGFRLPGLGGLGDGLGKLGLGLKGSVAAVGRAGQDLIGNARNVDDELEKTGGFEMLDTDGPARDSSPNDANGRRQQVQFSNEHREKTTNPTAGQHSRAGNTGHSDVAAHKPNRSSTFHHSDKRDSAPPAYAGNQVRKIENEEDIYNNQHVRWYEFWKPPAGGYASPVPMNTEGNEFPFKEKSIWQQIKESIPFIGKNEEEIDYDSAVNPDYKEEAGAAWEQWLKPKDRPHHRIPWFDWTPGWLPGIPGLHTKTDTIYWCRGELARLNLEIEEDQNHPERYEKMSAAFIQFNNQVAAHMACQSVAHHLPEHMSPRLVEVSPDDVLWENMAINQFGAWLRTAIVISVVVGMVILWAIPIGFTGAISDVQSLIRAYPWLSFLQRNDTVYSTIKAVAGVLPAVLLAILLVLVPIILSLLAGFQGVKTGSEKTQWVQKYYFTFLFIQVFLVVSVAKGAAAMLTAVAQDITSIPNQLAQNLPKSTDYFYSYMILQALSVSSGTLLQIGSLAVFYVLSRLFDNTARGKFNRQISLPTVNWGSFFPVYTNFACISLIYSIISPLISLFALITFSLLWVAQRYNMLYVQRFKSDTGGVLYPSAINQTFTGLYVMELCMVGLFFLQQDENGNLGCIPQAIIMIIMLVLTALFQLMMNYSFGPLLKYLPITFEDEAVIRDEIFQREQDRRLGLTPSEDEDESRPLTKTHSDGSPRIHKEDSDIEMQRLHGADDNLHHNGHDGTHEPVQGHSRNFSSKLSNLNPVKGLRDAGTWAVKSGQTVQQNTFGKADATFRSAAQYRRDQRRKDLEAQRAMGEALYGGFSDEIEDLTPDERDTLVKKAFTHSALRARRPVVWIPRDDLGVSDDEVLRTKDFSDYVWISNEGTALDSKARAVYGRAPPDFSELELINL